MITHKLTNIFFLIGFLVSCSNLNERSDLSTPPPSIILQVTPSSVINFAPQETDIPAIQATKTPPGALGAQVSAPMIRWAGWSIESTIFAFWMFEAGQSLSDFSYPPGELHFFITPTGQICVYPYEAKYQDDWSKVIAWRNNGKVAVLSSDPPRLGTPCKDDFVPITVLPDIVDDSNISISPSGGYQTETTIVDAAAFLAETSIIALQSRRIVNQIEWQSYDALGGLGTGGEWVTENKFLVYQTLDQGPLLLDVSGEIVRVNPDLFGLAPCHGNPCQNFDEATAQTVDTMSTFHLLLQHSGDEPGTEQFLLYHSEDDLVEEISAKRLWWPGFSPDGKWLILDKGGGGNSIWIRPVDPLGSEFYLFADNSNHLIWSPDGSKVAFRSKDYRNVHVFSFPNGNEIGFWNLGKYEVNSILWSPNGKYISVSGYLNSQEDSLYIFQVP